MVLEKRSINRCNKKYWGKGKYLTDILVKKRIERLPQKLRGEVEDMIEKFKNCTSKSNDTGRRKKKGKKAAKQYIPLVGDPCYNYSREAKERFFRNGACAFLFLLAKDHMET